MIRAARAARATGVVRAARAGGAAVAVAAVALAPVALAPHEPAHAAAACTGVAVVVDFGSLGGGVQSRCAAGDPRSGLAALSAAGFGYAFAPSGLICQINGRPDPCPRVPPATAYWSYWHARSGGAWTYSNSGAGSYDPAPGTVEGWAFGAGRQPGIAPPAAAAPAPPPAPPPPTAQPPPQQPPVQQPPRTGVPASGGVRPTAGPGGGGSTQGDPGPVPSGPVPSGAGTAPGQPTASASATAATSDAGDPATGIAPAARDGATPPTGRGVLDTLALAAGIALIGGLGGLAWWTARRRARASGRPSGTGEGSGAVIRPPPSGA